jgi:hypothetical protein
VDDTDLAGRIIARCDKLKSDRGSWNQIWQECSDYILPRRSLFTRQVSTPTNQVQVNIYDGTAVWANEQLASGLHSYLTSPNERFFRLQFKSPEMKDDEEANLWLEECTTIMYDVLNSPKTNFSPQIHELYLDLGAFGTAIMMIEEADDPRGPPVRFCTYHLGRTYIDENYYGQVDTVYRDMTLNPRVAQQFFGDHPDIIQALASKANTDLEFVHAIFPRKEMDSAPGIKLPERMPYGSVYIHRKTKAIMRQSGYYEFPVVAPRWSKITGEINGRGPGVTCLPDIKMVNEMAKTLIKASQKAVDPPLMLPDEGFLLPIKTMPGGLNFYNAGMDEHDRIQPLQTNANIPIGLEIMDSRREHIMRTFFLDAMQLHEGPEMTATEVMQRTEDRMRMMAPAVSRLQSELLDPTIERVFAILARRGFFPPIPAHIQGLDLKIEYVSPVAKAQKRGQAYGFTRMLELLMPIGQMKPEMYDNFDPDGTVHFMADLFDAPSQMVLPQSKVDEIRAARNQAAKEANDAQQQNLEADTSVKETKAAQQATSLTGGGLKSVK